MLYTYLYPDIVRRMCPKQPGLPANTLPPGSFEATVLQYLANLNNSNPPAFLGLILFMRLRFGPPYPYLPKVILDNQDSFVRAYNDYFNGLDVASQHGIENSLASWHKFAADWVVFQPLEDVEGGVVLYIRPPIAFDATQN